MGIYDRLQRARADVTFQPMDPLHPRWYGEIANYASTFAGFPIGPDSAVRVSAVFACVSLKAETVGGLPLHLYRRLEDGGRERAKDHRLYKTVRQEPNGQHSPMEFFSSCETRINLRGAALNWIQERPTGVSLIPIPPRDVLKVEQLDTGRLRFEIRDPSTGRPRSLSQDEAFYIRDLMEDGFAAYARAALAREAIAVAAAAEAAVGGFFKNDMTGRLLIKHPTSPDEKKRAEYREAFQENYAGWAHTAKAMWAWGGLDVTELGKQDNANFLVDPRKMQVAEIARYFGRIPLFMIGLEEKSTTWGTGIEQQTQAWINYGMLPSLVRIEQAANRDLLFPEEREEFFFEFNLDGLLRGDSYQRAQTNEIKKRNGVINADEWRVMDNLNPRGDAGGKQYQDNAPGAAANAVANADGSSRRPPPPEDEDEEPKARRIPAPLLADAVNRIAGREIGDLAARVSRSSDPEKFRAWVVGYYADHHEYVTKVVAPIAQAFGYEQWVVDECADRVCATAAGLVADGVVQFTARRRETVAAILNETFRAGAAVRRAA